MSGALKTLTLDVDGRRVVVAQHALQRYAMRASAFPDEPHRARRQLGQVARNVGEFGEKPGWVNDRPDDSPEHRDEAVGWLLLGDDVALPLVERGGDLVAVTCLARGTMSGAARARRSEWKRAKRAAARRGRETRAWMGESGPRWR